jgi:hypothetical protein
MLLLQDVAHIYLVISDKRMDSIRDHMDLISFA